MSIAPFSEEDVLLSALGGDAGAQARAVEALGGYVETRARAHLKPRSAFLAKRYLALDLVEDVIQQSWLLLFAHPAGAFRPERGTARSFIDGIVRNAARDVRASYAPPGWPTRPAVGHPLPAILSLEALQEAERAEPFDIPDTSASIEANPELVIAQIEADRLVALGGQLGPVWLPEAMARIAAGARIGDTAATLGVSRFQVRRELDVVGEWIAA
jgi:hypothetical protein